MASERRATVIGGSISGLSAAVALREIGWQVDVYERSTGELASRGAGLGMQWSLARMLAEFGIDPFDVSTSSQRLCYLGRDGASVFEAPAAGRYTAWNTMYRVLRDRFGDLERYHPGERLIEIENTDRAAIARFSSGAEVAADLLVCCDGSGSTARRLLAPGTRNRYAGYIGWRGLVPERDLPRSQWETFDGAITYSVIPEARSHIIIYPVPGADGEIGPGERRVNFVWYWNVPAGAELTAALTDRHGTRHESSMPAGLTDPRLAERMRRTAAELMAPQAAELVAATTEPFLQTITEAAAPQMVYGRTCLVGDAAMTVRPHAGAATAKAAEDVRALRDLLRDTADVPAALQAWQRRQIPIGRGLLHRSAELGDRSQRHGTWQPGDPSLAPGLLGPADRERPAD
jgi:2,6-dihydroxypyridine 3-monooxygenase